MKKVEVPLYEKQDKRGRPLKYNYAGFLNPSTTFVVIEGFGIEHYNSIRSTFTRWKRLNGVNGSYRFDFYRESAIGPKRWVIWRK